MTKLVLPGMILLHVGALIFAMFGGPDSVDNQQNQKAINTAVLELKEATHNVYKIVGYLNDISYEICSLEKENK